MPSSKNDPILHRLEERDYRPRNNIQHDRRDNATHSTHYYQVRKCVAHVHSENVGFLRFTHKNDYVYLVRVNRKNPTCFATNMRYTLS